MVGDADAPIVVGQLASLEMTDMFRGIAALPEEERRVIVLVAAEGCMMASGWAGSAS